MLSLIVDRVEPFLCNKSICDVFDLVDRVEPIVCNRVAFVLSLIVDRVEPILCTNSICAVFDCRQSRTHFVQQEHLCCL